MTLRAVRHCHHSVLRELLHGKNARLAGVNDAHA